MYKILYEKQALKDIQNLKSAHLDLKEKALVEVGKKNPFENPPPYESLIGNLSGLYSRRINIQHRFVYEVIAEEFFEDQVKYEGYVKIIRMWTHYEKI